MLRWHGQGKDQISSEAFSQLENDSDRAVGIVAGSIVEQRLTEAIKAKFIPNDTIRKRMFDVTSGPLGTFGAKIDIALLLGIITTEARVDLRAMKDVRNAFAHNLEIDSFEHSDIKGRCLGMKLIEQHIRELTEDEYRELVKFGEDMRSGRYPERGTADELPAVVRDAASPPLKIAGANEMLADAKRRFVLCAKIFSSRLGAGTNFKWPLPLL